MCDFKLKFTDIDTESGEVLSTYLTKQHGWKNTTGFLARQEVLGHQLIHGGSIFKRCNGTITTKIEIVFTGEDK